MYLKCPVFHVPTHSILCTCCQEDKVPLVEKKAKARTKWEESAAHIITVLMPPNANATIASFPCFPQITSIHFFQIIVQEMFVFCGFFGLPSGEPKCEIPPAGLQGKVGLTQWHHPHLLSHRPHRSAAEQFVLCVLSRSLCFVQLHYGDRRSHCTLS